jgi:hypothetical protein
MKSYNILGYDLGGDSLIYDWSIITTVKNVQKFFTYL